MISFELWQPLVYKHLVMPMQGKPDPRILSHNSEVIAKPVLLIRGFRSSISQLKSVTLILTCQSGLLLESEAQHLLQNVARNILGFSGMLRAQLITAH